MAPVGLAGGTAAGYVLTHWIPADVPVLGAVALGGMGVAGVASICLWLSDGFLGSLRNCVEVVRWVAGGRLPVCWNCRGTGRNPIRTTVGLVVDFTFISLISSVWSFGLLEGLYRVAP
jgi:hypothetical protein